jgi:hypothetical protein
VITVDTNRPLPKHESELKAEGHISEAGELRQVKSLNNLIEQDHRFMKRLTKPGMGFFLLRDGMANTARLRDHEHDQKRTRAKSEERGWKRPSCLDRSGVWNGCISSTRSETSRPSCSPVSFCNTTCLGVCDFVSYNVQQFTFQ